MKEGTIKVKTPGDGERMANLELLRCVAMMMVVVLHYLGKGDLLGDLTEGQLGSMGTAAWLLESFCIVAVNVYMFLSGYFLCMSQFKPSRLIQLWLQVWVYSVAFGLAGAAAGWLGDTAFDTHYLLTLVFPVTMEHYWFMTAYIFLYLLLPFVGVAMRKMTKQQLQLSLGLLFLVFCLWKSILPLRLETDAQGYDCLWYLCVFVAAAYLRRFGAGFLEKRGRSLALYVGGCLLVFGGTMALRQVYLHTGSLERMLKMCLEYNHVLPFAAAVGLFGIFYRIHLGGKAAAAGRRAAPHALGVYLLHENLGLRYAWQKWFRSEFLVSRYAAGGSQAAEVFGAVGSLLLWTVLAAAGVFVCGILVDMVRKVIFDLLHRGLMRIGLYRRGISWIESADRVFGTNSGGKNG